MQGRIIPPKVVDPYHSLSYMESDLFTLKQLDTLLGQYNKEASSSLSLPKSMHGFLKNLVPIENIYITRLKALHAAFKLRLKKIPHALSKLNTTEILELLSIILEAHFSPDAKTFPREVTRLFYYTNSSLGFYKTSLNLLNLMKTHGTLTAAYVEKFYDFTHIIDFALTPLKNINKQNFTNFFASLERLYENDNIPNFFTLHLVKDGFTNSFKALNKSSSLTPEISFQLFNNVQHSVLYFPVIHKIVESDLSQIDKQSMLNDFFLPKNMSTTFCILYQIGNTIPYFKLNELLTLRHIQDILLYRDFGLLDSLLALKTWDQSVTRAERKKHMQYLVACTHRRNLPVSRLRDQNNMFFSIFSFLKPKPIALFPINPPK